MGSRALPDIIEARRAERQTPPDIAGALLSDAANDILRSVFEVFRRTGKWVPPTFLLLGAQHTNALAPRCTRARTAVTLSS
jgi:hypothetical protein